MEKIIKESTVYTDVFVSVDGREFKTEADCKAWETSYKGTLMESVQKLHKIETNGADLYLQNATYDDEVWVLKLNSIDEVVLLNAWIKAFTSSDMVLTTDIIGKEIALNFGYERDWCEVRILTEHIEQVKKVVERVIGKLNGNEEEQK